MSTDYTSRRRCFLGNIVFPSVYRWREFSTFPIESARTIAPPGPPSSRSRSHDRRTLRKRRQRRFLSWIFFDRSNTVVGCLRSHCRPVSRHVHANVSHDAPDPGRRYRARRRRRFTADPIKTDGGGHVRAKAFLHAARAPGPSRRRSTNRISRRKTWNRNTRFIRVDPPLVRRSYGAETSLPGHHLLRGVRSARTQSGVSRFCFSGTPFNVHQVSGLNSYKRIVLRLSVILYRFANRRVSKIDSDILLSENQRRTPDFFF